MTTSESEAAPVRFSTRDIPVRERVAYWREMFGRQICHVEIEPHADIPLEAEATMAALSGIAVCFSSATSPACWKRTADMVKDGRDGLALLIPLAGTMMRSQLGHDFDVGAGEGVAILDAEPASIRFNSLKHVAVVTPREALAPLLKDWQRAATRPIGRSHPALHLLRSYLLALNADLHMSQPVLGGVVASHLYDLVALALGPTRDSGELARRRGLAAARLQALKKDVANNPALSLGALAARHRVSRRYIQMLFEADGTSFTAFTLEQRLARAHGMLTDGRNMSRTISAIAYDAGFGDLSHFNRSFRRRYGAAPSEVRAETTRRHRS
jgi:AraC-like DNA-binding protein